jgi:hypothetical protein
MWQKSATGKQVRNIRLKKHHSFGIIEMKTMGIKKFREEDIVEEIGYYTLLPKEWSLLPCNIWIDEGSRSKQYKHPKCVYVQPNYKDNTKNNDWIPMSISRKPKWLGDTSKLVLKTKDVDKVKNFIVQYYQLLLDIANMKNNIFELYNELKSIRNKKFFNKIINNVKKSYNDLKEMWYTIKGAEKDDILSHVKNGKWIYLVEIGYAYIDKEKNHITSIDFVTKNVFGNKELAIREADSLKEYYSKKKIAYFPNPVVVEVLVVKKGLWDTNVKCKNISIEIDYNDGNIIYHECVDDDKYKELLKNF